MVALCGVRDMISVMASFPVWLFWAMAYSLVQVCWILITSIFCLIQTIIFMIQLLRCIIPKIHLLTGILVFCRIRVTW